MARTGETPEISDEVPWSETLTLYDETHLVTYLRLLDASDDGASTDEMVRARTRWRVRFSASIRPATPIGPSERFRATYAARGG